MNQILMSRVTLAPMAIPPQTDSWLQTVAVLLITAVGIVVGLGIAAVLSGGNSLVALLIVIAELAIAFLLVRARRTP